MKLPTKLKNKWYETLPFKARGRHPALVALRGNLTRHLRLGLFLKYKMCKALVGPLSGSDRNKTQLKPSRVLGFAV